MFDLTIREVAQKLRSKEFSVRELVLATLDKIQKEDIKINAFVTVCADQALEAANRADKLIAKTPADELPILCGIPFTAKDVFCTKGVETTASSNVLKNFLPPYDATPIKRVKQEGAILIGKTNCDAWGHGASTENSDFFPTRNPWNLDYVPGGSCGGSAAAVACGMGFFSIAEDTGGSIRQPSAFCNVTGLKVTYGRVSRYGAIAFACSLDTVGPIAKTVDDCALVLQKIAGPDDLDATAVLDAPPDYINCLTKGFKNIVLGLPKEYYGAGLDKEIRQAIDETIRIFEGLGARTIEISLPATARSVPTYYIIAPSETSSNLARYDGIRFGHSRDSFGAEAKRRIMLGTYALSAGYYDAYYKRAMKVRNLIKKDFDKAFTEVDAIIAPITPTPPFKIGEKTDDPVAMYLCDVYSGPINLAGIPSLAMPCGFTKNNLPIGFQLIGPQLSESLLFAAGHAYQQVTDWHKRKPNLN
ncbi:MAG: Asp-tRNA(Asn)/Glu-tRNA(Gln) amidotransferase subunit GatA [bacterium]|nr:Asp-tRNA(Asn)/Glu-tRNA(Gln) amidotransferase subunit GatA [bacterium]